MADSKFYSKQKPSLESLFKDIEEEQNKISKYDEDVNKILNDTCPIEEKKYHIRTLSGAINICDEKIHHVESMIISHYKEILQKKDFSTFNERQQSILEKIYTENEYYINYGS